MLAARASRCAAAQESLAILRRPGSTPGAAQEANGADWSRRVPGADHRGSVVDGIDAAIDHINTCSSGHTEAIITENHSHAMRFLRGSTPHR